MKKLSPSLPRMAGRDWAYLPVAAIEVVIGNTICFVRGWVLLSPNRKVERVIPFWPRVGVHRYAGLYRVSVN